MTLERLGRQLEEARAQAARLQRTRDLPLDEIGPLDQALAQARETLEDLRAAEAELREQHETLQAADARSEVERQRAEGLVELIPGGFLETDRRDIIRAANSAAAALLSTSGPTLIGEPVAAFMRAADTAAWLAAVDRIKRGAAAQVELAVLLRPRGRQPQRARTTLTAARDPNGQVSGLG